MILGGTVSWRWEGEQQGEEVDNEPSYSGCSVAMTEVAICSVLPQRTIGMGLDMMIRLAGALAAVDAIGERDSCSVGGR